MRKTTAIFLFCLIFLVACASPVPQPTTTPTVRPTLTATATQTPAPTVTITPSPTEATPESYAVSGVEVIDQSLFLEKGTTFLVENFLGAGRAKITVVGVKTATDVQILNYLKFKSNKSNSLTGVSTIGNVTVESVSLLSIDLENNTNPSGNPIADGVWCYIRGGSDVKGDGKVTRFGIMNHGNEFNGNDPQDCYDNLSPGDVIKEIRMDPFEETFTFLENQAIVDENLKKAGVNVTQEQAADARLRVIGFGAETTSWESVIEDILNGRDLDYRKVSVLSFTK